MHRLQMPAGMDINIRTPVIYWSIKARSLSTSSPKGNDRSPEYKQVFSSSSQES